MREEGMAGKKTGDEINLFQSLARSRPEWLVQGAFMTAVHFDQRVRTALNKKLKGKFPEQAPKEVREEVVQDDYWRADVVVYWPDNEEPAKFELKLGSPPTERQKKAAIDAIVVPSGCEQYTRRLIKKAVIFTWAEIAKAVSKKNAFLERLFREADRSYSLWLEDGKLNVKEAMDAFDAVTNGTASWPTDKQLRAFLNMLDDRLREVIGNYYIGGSWSKTRTEQGEPYFGYTIWWRNKVSKGAKGHYTQGWLGFMRADSDVLRIQFEKVADDSSSRVRLGSPLTKEFRVERVAAEVKKTILGRSPRK